MNAFRTLLTFLITIVAFGCTAAEVDVIPEEIGPPPTPQGKWVTIAKDIEGTHPALALDSKGTIYLSYADTAYQGATVKRYDGSAWHLVGMPGFTQIPVYETALAIDPTDTPVIAYTRVYNNHLGLTVSRFLAPTWEIVGYENFTDDPRVTARAPAVEIALALTTNGTPFVAYHYLHMEVRRFHNSGWQLLGANLSRAPANWTYLRVSDEGRPYIAFNDEERGVVILTVQNGRWQDLPIAGSTIGGYFSFALNNEGVPHVACGGGNIGLNKARLLRFVSNQWLPVGILGFSELDAEEAEVSFDMYDYPYVAYVDKAYNERISVAWYNGEVWDAIGEKGFTPSKPGARDRTGLRRRIAFVVKDDGTPVVAYKDENRTITVMMFQRDENEATTTP